jgi:hypothetical protein
MTTIDTAAADPRAARAGTGRRDRRRVEAQRQRWVQLTPATTERSK